MRVASPLSMQGKSKETMTDSEDTVLAKIRDLATKGEVKMASTTGLDAMPDEHMKVVVALEKVRNIEVWFSDRSHIGDVFDEPDDPRVALLAEELGVPISASDPVVDVCLRLRALRPAID